MANGATSTHASGAADGYPKPAYAWFVIGLICIGYIFAFIDRIIVGMLTPAIQADLGLTDSQAGLLQGLAFAVFYTLFGVPLGLMADRYNRKWILTAGMTVWSFMTAACGMAASIPGLFLARIGVGVGEATLNPSVASLIGDYFRPKDRAKAFGIYVMATAFGTGLTYILGGLVIGYFAKNGGLVLPGVGELKVWQSVFVSVGLAGLIPALIFFIAVREPTRKDLVTKKGTATWAETKAFLLANKTTLICHHVGVSFIILGVYGWLNWMPTFFIRVHGWTAQQVGLSYGLPAAVAGVVSAISAPWLAGVLRKRGYIDATMRACLYGCVGCALGGVIPPLLPTANMSLTAFILAGVFANYPSVLALAAITEITPNELRGFITSTYIVMVGLVASGLGPLAVGVVTDSVFGDPKLVGMSITWVSLLTGIVGCALIGLGLKSFRGSLSRVTWGK